MKYYIFTFGCQMNHSDSERISALLERSGGKPIADPNQADLIVINACSVRQAAAHRVFGKIENFKNKKVIIAGCLLEPDKKKLSLHKNVSFWHPDDYFNLPPLRHSKFSAFVPIMTGCNNFCSYCVVPFTRGREKSRPADEIIAEVKNLVNAGYKEIVLIGQNVNSYKSRTDTNVSTNNTNKIRDQINQNSQKMNFAQLLKKINRIPGSFWLSFITSHPKDMSDELIETAAECKKVVPYIHLPVQSGDNEILKKMNRHYAVAHYKKLIKKLRAAFKKHRPAFPPLSVSTDIIAGFPGETKKQFENTLKLIKEVKFDMIYFAQYSPRAGTAAAKMPDDVPPKEKKRRAQAINSLLKKISRQINKKYIGKNIELLIEKTDKKSAYGKTATGKDVKVEFKNKLNPGDVAKVKIASASAFNLKAKK